MGNGCSLGAGVGKWSVAARMCGGTVMVGGSSLWVWGTARMSGDRYCMVGGSGLWA